MEVNNCHSIYPLLEHISQSLVAQKKNDLKFILYIVWHRRLDSLFDFVNEKNLQILYFICFMYSFKQKEQNISHAVWKITMNQSKVG